MFKHDFKFYKRRRPPPDLSGVLDLSKDFCSSAVIARRINQTCDDMIRDGHWGLKPVDEWRVYELTDRQGLLFIPNPFTALGQRYWVCRCLKDFTCKPQKLNLDAHGDLQDGQKWWDTCMKDTEKGKSLLQKLRWVTLGYHHNWDTKATRFLGFEQPDVIVQKPLYRTHVTIWCAVSAHGILGPNFIEDEEGNALTITQEQYRDMLYSEDSRGPFPEDLAVLCQYIARVVGLNDFSAEAAIVNYYHMDSTLAGHTDHSELNKEAPLFSFSFGQSALFLLGGLSVDEKPAAMFIHSGDIIIMSGVSRLCYHGIPRILSMDKTPWNAVDSRAGCIQRECCDDSVVCDTEDYGSARRCRKETNSTFCPSCFSSEIIHSCTESYFWEPFGNYLRTSRINMNVRQVLQPAMKSLPQQL